MAIMVPEDVWRDIQAGLRRVSVEMSKWAGTIPYRLKQHDEWVAKWNRFYNQVQAGMPLHGVRNGFRALVDEARAIMTETGWRDAISSFTHSLLTSASEKLGAIVTAAETAKREVTGVLQAAGHISTGLLRKLTLFGLAGIAIYATITTILRRE